jgi:cytochrome b involved in lipid metabolism
MTTKKLLVSFISVFILVFITYIFVSPFATKTLNAPVIDTSTTTDQMVESEDVPVVDVKDESPKPTPTPTSPEPAPTPVVTGYTSAEVAIHASESSCWSIVNGIVYDLTSYISKHPGGSSKVLRICGKDGSSAFEGQHGGESKPERILAGYKIGPLK